MLYYKTRSVYYKYSHSDSLSFYRPKGGVSMFANDYGFCLLKIRNLRYYGCIDLKSEGVWSCSTCFIAILVSESGNKIVSDQLNYITRRPYINSCIIKK